MMMGNIQKTWFAILFISSSGSIFTSTSANEENELAAIYGGEDFVSIATGAAQPIARAPAVATIITAAQIRSMGATDLDQVLETVPGLHVANFYQGYNPIYIIRGIYTDTNPQVLLLINGIPITNLYQGNRGQVWGGLPINNISRIEVIRGPGSALYGADAYAGVVNIITKSANDIRGTVFGARLGSFNSKDAWLLHGANYRDMNISYSMEYGVTNGQHRNIEFDAQTSLDTTFIRAPFFATPSSLAPGPVNLGRKYLEARIDASRDSWQIRAGYQGRYDVETGAGVAQALDPAGTNKSARFNVDISYYIKDVQEWDSTLQISYFDTSAQSDLVLYPPGAFAGAFPDGLIGNPDVFERHARVSASTFYTGLLHHRVRFGAGINYGDLYKVGETKNYAFGPAGIMPLGRVVDVSTTSPFIRTSTRTNSYIFAQDEWSFAHDWALTVGMRYDDYSDFGDTLNPRAAIVWQTDYNLTSKFLYGRAFRAPSFAELYNINNPVALGNPSLKPETIDTLELAFDYQISDKVSTGLNLFYYQMQDIIRFVRDPAPATTITAQNTGNQHGYGLEWELNWAFSKILALNTNYAFQHSEDQATETDSGNAPHHEIYARLNWLFAHQWSLNPQVVWIGQRQRMFGDQRPPLKGYTLVDVTLRRSKINNAWDVGASLRNLFNADAREPTPSPGLIPNDLPLQGRSIYLEAAYSF